MLTLGADDSRQRLESQLAWFDTRHLIDMNVINSCNVLVITIYINTTIV